MEKFLIGGTRIIANIIVSEDGNATNDKQWLIFNSWRNLLGYKFHNLAISLTVPKNVPNKYIFDRWKAEKISYVIIPISIFTSDIDGLTLSK